MKLSRRTLLRSGAAAVVAPAVGPLALDSVAHANEGEWRHGLSLFGDLKYPPGFKRFDYVNPNAPKGGAARLGGLGTFDNFNLVVSGVKGNASAGLNELYDTLVVASLDEVSAEYGLLAEAVSHPADFSSVIYRLRPEAKWHDGKPVTPADVIFSLQAFQKNHPMLSAYYRHVTESRADRRARGHLHVRRSRQSRAAADRRPAHRAAEALVGRDRCLGQEARRDGHHARTAAWLRRVPHQGVRRRPHGRVTSASRITGLATST